MTISQHVSPLFAALKFRITGGARSDSSSLRPRESQEAGVYYEEDPTVLEWSRQLQPSRAGFLSYGRSLFPSATWIRRYNWSWLLGDAIAGFTIGFVVVPQAMAYALLARLSPEFGLYTSFVGAVLYWLFGTSKDIVIGTTAIGSLLVGSVVSHVEDKYPGKYTAEETAKALSLITGAILLFIGLARLGWLIEFIPYIPISAFVTSASITIMSTQIPVLLGITGINTREAPYRVFINTFKGLGRTKLDAAIGLTSLVLLSLIKTVCAKMETRQPANKRLWVMMSSLRLAFTVLLFTFVSWLVHRSSDLESPRFRIVGKIEAGFTHVGVPKPSTELLVAVLQELPAIAIILIIEHIAIAKSFGRIFHYTVQPSQEIVALGMANLFSPFMGGYVCTGSFGASAVLSKAGVRTPLAGLFSAVVLVLALYALTAVFKYIPMAALAGLILHAIFNLITPPSALYRYWQLSPIEFFVWVCGVVISIFVSLEVSIYVTIALSAAILLLRISHSKGHLLSQVELHYAPQKSRDLPSQTHPEQAPAAEGTPEPRTVFLPIKKTAYFNPRLHLTPRTDGILVYRFAEGFNYTNQSQHVSRILQMVKETTRRTQAEDGLQASDRLWNDAGPAADADSGIVKHQQLPILRAVVLDCSAVNNIDITSVQGLVDLRDALDRYAAPESVEWHFASLNNRWARRALAVVRFGSPSSTVESVQQPQPGTIRPLAALAPHRDVLLSCESMHRDVEGYSSGGESGLKIEQDHGCGDSAAGMGPVVGVNRPNFHVDLLEAVEAATLVARRKDRRMHLGST